MDWTVLVIAAVAGAGAFIGAYFAERAKIAAQTKALESIVRQEAAKARGQEEAKQQVIAENLKNLDMQMRTLTTTQEQIKAQISGELWYRQTTWNEKKELYGELLRVLVKLSAYYAKLQVAIGSNNPVGELREGIRVQNDELFRLGALARIFGAPGCDSIDNYFRASELIPNRLSEKWASEEVRNVNILMAHLTVIAKEDLRVIIAPHR